MKNNTFHLKGYSLPLTLQGKSSLVEPPPWHYGGKVLQITFKTDVDLVKQLLPPPFELGSDPGLAFVWFVDLISVSDSNLSMTFINPERTQYKECLIGLHCKLKGSQGYFIPHIWVDNDFTLMRGIIQGFPKKLGRIYMTRLNEIIPKLGGIKSGAKITGICESHGDRLITGTIKLNRLATEKDVPKIKFFLMRHFPSIENPNEPSIHEISESITQNIEFGEIWKGKANLIFGKSNLDEIIGFEPKEILSGFYFNLGFTISGGRVLYRY